MSEAAARRAAEGNRPRSDPAAIAALHERLGQGLSRGNNTRLHDAALSVLNASEVQAKLSGLAELLDEVCAGRLGPESEPVARTGPAAPGRPARPPLVAPRELRQRRLGSPEGRAALLHAVAHIEFNAINLALDAVQRFTGLSVGYYADWLSVADDEARHFRLLQARLNELGHQYGDFPAHDGLWQMACDSADSVLSRMALVPRLLEARGLDVTPAMMDRLRQVGDQRSAACLAVILEEEERHVAIGSRWHQRLCRQQGLDPQTHFLELLSTRGGPALRGPYNVPARLRAGFSESELASLAALATGATAGPPARPLATAQSAKSSA